jgi:hypothetical protein
MKKCSYCGAEYPDDAVTCAIDQTPLEHLSAPTPPEPKRAEHSEPAEYDFVPIAEVNENLDLVTLVQCGTLVAADQVVARLRAVGIETFLPDEFLMQSVGGGFNTFGYVRVQVAPKDYDTAKNLLSGPDPAGR